jgi:hypothetical protein
MNSDTQNLGAPEKMQRALGTRPEKAFERRRKTIFLSLALIVVAIVLFILQKCGEPVKVNGLMDANSAQAAAVLPSPTAVKVAIPAPDSALVPTQVVRLPAPVNGQVICYATRDVPAGETGFIPAQAQVRVTGYSAARSGMVEIEGGWYSLAGFRCDGDVTALERPFRMALTPTPVRKSVSVAAVPAQAIPVNPSPVIVPTLLPYPAATATATPDNRNGIWLENGCWRVRLEGVQEIWVNGKGTSNGLYCGATEIRFVIAK